MYFYVKLKISQQLIELHCLIYYYQCSDKRYNANVQIDHNCLMAFSIFGSEMCTESGLCNI